MLWNWRKTWILEVCSIWKIRFKNRFLWHISIQTPLMRPLERSLDEKKFLISETLCWPCPSLDWSKNAMNFEKSYLSLQWQWGYRKMCNTARWNRNFVSKLKLGYLGVPIKWNLHFSDKWELGNSETYSVRIFPPPWSRTHPWLYFCLLVIFRRPFTFVCCHFAKMFCVSVIRLLYHIFLSQWNPRNHCNLVCISFF